MSRRFDSENISAIHSRNNNFSPELSAFKTLQRIFVWQFWQGGAATEAQYSVAALRRLCQRSYLIWFDYKNSGYVFWLKAWQVAAKYPLLGDFKNPGYEKSYFLRGIRARISSILKMKFYWISAERNSSLKSEIHIHYFKKRGLFDSTLICVCLISQKTIQ